MVDHRQVLIEEAHEVMQEYNLAGHIELSSKTGENVEESFKLISELLMKESDRLAQNQSNNSSNDDNSQ